MQFLIKTRIDRLKTIFKLKFEFRYYKEILILYQGYLFMDATSTAQDCRQTLPQLQAAIGCPNSQQDKTTLQAWQAVKSRVSDRLIPELNAELLSVEAQNNSPQRATQLRSLNPEVTRLIKLLQIDWQFWQAARSSDRLLQRQQQLLMHLQQLDQLLAAIETLG
jgi:hypothetical protein